MITFVTILHVVVCFVLVLVILLQAGKGGGMGSAFGGAGAQTVFGGRGAQTFLGKVTSISAGIFMLTSLTLAYQSSRSASEVERQASAPAPFEVPGQGAGGPAAPPSAPGSAVPPPAAPGGPAGQAPSVPTPPAPQPSHSPAK